MSLTLNSIPRPECCTLCPIRSLPVLPEGPRPARVMIVGEGPARDEIRQGRPFVGQSGQELRGQYLPLAGLSDEDVWITNACKCACPGFRNPTIRESRYCSAGWLPAEIRRVRPEFIVTLGARACRAMFPECSLKLEHGTPRLAQYGEWEGIHVPCYHPAAGLHEEQFMLPLRSDFEALGKILRGEFVLPIDPYPNPLYKEVETVAELEHLITKYSARRCWTFVAQDTETVDFDSRSPYCLSFSFKPGTGYVIFTTNQKVVSAWGSYIKTYRPLTILHNALFDLEVLERMGVVVTRYSCTMQLAYNIGDLPQGLKALAYRLCGMRMHDFDDLARPYSVAKVQEWLRGILESAEESGWGPPPVLGLPPLPRRPSKPRLPALPRGKALGTPAGVGRLLEVMEERTRLQEEFEAQQRAFSAVMLEALEAREEAEQTAKAEKGEYSSDPLTKGVKKARRLLSDLETGTQEEEEEAEADDDAKPTNPWDRIKKWAAEERGVVEMLGGPAPKLSLIHVPKPEAIRYAAEDAAGTLSILPELRRRARELGHRVDSQQEYR